MDSIVTARVPSGIKEEGRAALQRIGATPTDLVNAAYRYVLAKGKLPEVDPLVATAGQKSRRLSAEQKRNLTSLIERTTFAVPDSYWADRTDDELLAEALREKYARLD